MTVNLQYPNRPESQSRLAPSLAWGKTWRRNPNYRHGRWSRYRTRLEYRLSRAQVRVRSYLSEAPRFAPYAHLRDWPTVPLGGLPRRRWLLAVAYLVQVRTIRAWWTAWLRKLQLGGDPETPVPALAVVSLLFQIGRTP